MRLRIQTTKATTLGVLWSLLLGGLLGFIAFRGATSASFDFRLVWLAGAVAFLSGLISGMLLINVRRYAFNAALQTLILQDRWLGFARGKPRMIPFSEISAVYMRNSENAYAVVVLRSGKKLCPYSSGTVRKTNRYCGAIKRITRVGRVLPAERRARRRAGTDERLPIVVVSALCVLLVSEMLFAEKFPTGINAAFIAAAILAFLILGVLALRGTRQRGGGIGPNLRESLQIVAAGMCPNCGCATEGNVRKCPACGMRLR